MTRSTRLHLAALVIAAAFTYGTREAPYAPGDEADLAKVLDAKGAQDLVGLQVIPASVLADPDSLPHRAAFEALGYDELEIMAAVHDITPLAIETAESVTKRDLVDALLAAGVAPPIEEPPAAPAVEDESDAPADA